MRKVLVIGIGAGDPEHVTMQAVRAMNEADVFFVLDKGDVKRDLVDLREEILRRYVEHDDYGVVHDGDPERDRTASEYEPAVGDWRRRRADVCERLIRDELADGQCGAFLVWGDPTLYDSTLGVLEEILARGRLTFTYDVVPGISSVSALAARHRAGLNRVGGSVLVTTGRRLREGGLPRDTDDVVVMLDSQGAYRHLAHPEDVDIHWGAYVGSPDEILVAGRLHEVADEIATRRAEARRRKGWVMDTYVLRRRRCGTEGDGDRGQGG